MNVGFKQVKDIFLAALERQSPDARESYLNEACGADESLRRQVEALLHKHEQAGSFLESPPADPASHTATLDQPVTERPGAVIGPYKLMEQIGEGGMGLVFVAEQHEPVRRKVALKLIKPGMDSREIIARFQAERQALALMDHPNIARVLDAGATSSGRPYFVMELVKGVPITQFCDDNRLSPRERLELFTHVCHAVQHAHQKGIIHRDIKPSNVLVTSHDGRPVVKVIDFGVAKAIGQQLTERTIYTAMTQMVGTPLYMSPEQAGMSGLDIDTRTDIYSLGVLLYELLTGTTPFDKERLKHAAYDEMRRIIREEEPQKPSTRISTTDAAPSIAACRHTEPAKLAKLVRGDLDWIVMKALEKDRNRRYETANGFAADVLHNLADEPVLASPPSAAYRLRKFMRRNKRPVLAVSLMLSALVAGAIGAIYGVLEASKQRAVTLLYQRAEAARGEAEAARDAERAAKREADAAREKLAAVEYGRTMQVAYQHWRENNVPAALTLLDSTRTDFRGWEWSYVHRLCHCDILTFRNHSGAVLAAAFSPDGLRVVTGSVDRTAKVWLAASGSEVLSLRGHTGAVTSASFSPDGTRILTGSQDCTARIWDASSGADLRTLKGHSKGVASALFSPDGSSIVTASEDGTAKVWNAGTGEEILTLAGHSNPLVPEVARGMSASFSPDSSRVVTASYDGAAKVWDAKSGAPLLTLKGQRSFVTAASYSPDGSKLLTASFDGTGKIWDAQTGAEIVTLDDPIAPWLGASFSPDGSLIVTGSLDRTAKVLSALTGAEVRTLKGHTGYVVATSFNPDGSKIVTASSDGSAKLWDASAQSEQLILKGHSEPVMAASFGADGSRIITGSMDRKAMLWDAKTGTLLRTFAGHSLPVVGASLSPDGVRAATASHDRTVKVWDTEAGTELLTLNGHDDIVTSACFSPDGSLVLTASYDQTARLWHARTGAEVLAIKGHTAGLRSAQFSPDGSRIVTCGLDNTARVWDAKTGAHLLDIAGHANFLMLASFSSDGSRIVTSSFDRTAKLWNAKTGAEILTFKGHTDGLFWASFSPDGSRVITASQDLTAKLWDANTGVEVLTLRGAGGSVFFAASFSADRSRLVTAGSDNTAKVWDATRPAAAPKGP